jgi:hypothetical protein
MESRGPEVVGRLRALGLEVEACTSDDARVVFVPDGRLTLTFDAASHVEVGLALPPRDVPALRGRFADAERALELTTVIEALPEQFETGAAGDGARLPASRASSDELRALLERLERDQEAWWLGWRVPRAAAMQHAAQLDELLEDALVALGGLLALVAWTPARAAAEDPRTASLSRRRERARRDEESHAGGGHGAHASHGSGGSNRSHRRAVTHARNARERDPEGEVEADPQAPGEGEPAPVRSPRGANAPVSPRPGLRRRALAAVDPRAPIEKGIRVRVLEGPFAGKIGLVQELDGRGGARVMLGLLAVRLDAKDVVACAEGRMRPRLSSSHRKPQLVRS